MRYLTAAARAAHSAAMSDDAFYSGMNAGPQPRPGCSACEKLHDRLTEVLEVIGLEEDKLWRLKKAFHLTRKEAAILAALAHFQRPMTKDSLMLMAYAVEEDRPELKIIDVFICKLRRKLPVDLHPQTVWGAGYVLDDAARKAIQAIMRGDSEGESDGDEEDTTIPWPIRPEAAEPEVVAFPVPQAKLEIAVPRGQPSTVHGRQADTREIALVARTATDIMAG